MTHVGFTSITNQDDHYSCNSSKKITIYQCLLLFFSLQVFMTMHKLNVIHPLFQLWELINCQMIIITYCRQLKHWIINKSVDLMIPYL
jgi:hypothetical protein